MSVPRELFLSPGLFGVAMGRSQFRPRPVGSQPVALASAEVPVNLRMEMGTLKPTSVIGIVALLLTLGACGRGEHVSEAAADLPVVTPALAPLSGRHAVSYLYLGAVGPVRELAPTARDFLFQGIDAGRISIMLSSTVSSRLRLEAVCDGPARFIRERPGSVQPLSVAWVERETPLRWVLDPGERLRSRLELDPATSNCRLQVTPGGQPAHRLQLRREERARPRLAQLDAGAGRAHCSPPRFPPADRLAAVFHAQRALSQTCPLPPGRLRLLPDGGDALNAKIEALTGRALSLEALQRGDPDIALDFSDAPQLDLIYVSYLNVNADFTGYLMARMLAFHAARGTVVRLLVPDVMLTRTERRLFEGLAAQYPTIQLQPYRVPPSVGDGVDNQLGSIHRVSHVKMFAAIAREPGQSVAIVGGRNLHDGYFFAEPLDLGAWPFLQQYRPGALRIAGAFTSYVDFEIALHDDAVARAVVGHMGSYWHRDHDSQRLLETAPGRRVANGGQGPRLRHFLSVPYVDHAAQEALFVALVDAADTRIDISSPYLNLTPALEAAFDRARVRGVEMRMVTTVRVRETTEAFVTALNQQFANDHADWISLFDFNPYPRLLHSKLLVFDRRLAVVTSTNLNRRSFLHDTENGVMILDPILADRIGRVIDGYARQGTQVRPGFPVNPLVRTLLRWTLLRSAF